MEKSKDIATIRPNTASCTTCRFSGSMVNGANVIQTVCRRKSAVVAANAFPTNNGQILWATTTAWPAVTDVDWCGEYEAALSS